MRLSTVKKTVMATALAVAAVAVAGAPSNALALGFNFGDLGFYVYGGNDQRYESFGTGSSAPVLLSPSLTTRDISGDLTTLNAGAGTGLRYSVIGSSTDGLTFYVSSTSSTITTAQANNSFAANAQGEFLFWAGQHAAATGGVGNPLANNPSITPTSAPHSFTNILGTAGVLNGQLGFNTHGTLGQLLNIFAVTVDGVNPETYTKVASALLSTTGQLTITPSAVPIPAAVYLFGTGLVALVGIARRSMNKNKMAA
jgi:hypothetical protein